MSLASSICVFREILDEDAQLSRLGAKRGTLLRLHYQGRWEFRRGFEPRCRRLRFQQFGRLVDLELSAPYEGTFKGIFLDQEYACSELMTAPPARILDLGANIGMGSVHFCCQFPTAEFLCVEPDPRNLRLLERNLKANAVPFSIVHAAVGAAPGTLNLRFGDNPTCSALESSPMHDLRETIAVSVTTVPELLAKAKWDSVDLVKMDIEGSEDELLSKTSGWLSRVGALVLEIHPSTTAEKIASYLAPFGFRLQRLGHGREPVYFALRPAVDNTA